MSNSLVDVLQHWLQGQINTAVDGHSARLMHLESVVAHNQHLEDRIAHLELKVRFFEEDYPGFATTKDLLKGTDPAVLLDKMTPQLTQLFKETLQEYVKEVDLEENIEAILARRPQTCDSDKLDAQRYRWLREQHWSDGAVAVIDSPRTNTKVGTRCYSGGLLDAFIDERLQK